MLLVALGASCEGFRAFGAHVKAWGYGDLVPAGVWFTVLGMRIHCAVVKSWSLSASGQVQTSLQKTRPWLRRNTLGAKNNVILGTSLIIVIQVIKP